MRTSSFHGLIAALVLAIASLEVHAAQETNDLSGLTDESIRRVIMLVAHHQVSQVKDGDYSNVSSIAAARAAKSPTGIRWSNPWGVVLCGVLRASDVTSDKKLEAFVLDHNQTAATYWRWLKGLDTSVTNATKAQIRQFEDSTALGELIGFDDEGIMDYCGTMGVEMMEGILRHSGGKPSVEQKELVNAIADYIVNRQPRLPDGTFLRQTWRGTVWADDLYKGCAFLTRWSEFTGDPKHLDDAAKQIISMSTLLQDKDGLWFHGYFQNEHRNNGAKWGRANGWALLGTVEVLSAMPTNHPARPALLGILKRHVEALKKVQAASGAWHQLLDRPELWEETSCTAMFAYGIASAVNRGWIEPANMDTARKAFAAVCRKVTPDGAVTDVCEGSGIFWGYDYYVARRRPVDEMHGRGVVLLAGAEILSSAK